MGFILTLAYFFFTLVPPAELHASLAQANVMDALGVLAILVGVIELVIAQRRRTPPVQLALVVTLVLWATLSVVLALRWFGGAVLVLQSVIVNFGLFWLITLTGSSLRRLAVIRVVWLVTLAALVTIGIYDLRTNAFGGRFVYVQGRDVPTDEAGIEESPLETGGDEQTTRVGVRRLMALGYLHDPNQFAQMLVATLPLLFVGWHPGRPFLSLAVLALPSALFVYGIVLTGSRGGLVALGATVAAAAFLQRRRWLSLLTVAGTLVVLPIAFVLARRTARADDSAAGRMEAWSYGLQLLKESPVWGAGYGSFIEGHQLTAHNSFVLCFAELGLVGYMLWLSIFVVSFLQLSQIAMTPAESQVGRWAAGIRLGLIGFLAAAFFLSRTFSVLLFLLLGMATAVISVAKDSSMELTPLRPGRVFLVTGVLEVASIALIYVSMRLVR